MLLLFTNLIHYVLCFVWVQPQYPIGVIVGLGGSLTEVELVGQFFTPLGRSPWGRGGCLIPLFSIFSLKWKKKLYISLSKIFVVFNMTSVLHQLIYFLFPLTLRSFLGCWFSVFTILTNCYYQSLVNTKGIHPRKIFRILDFKALDPVYYL
jgi:hypothetical protein